MTVFVCRFCGFTWEAIATEMRHACPQRTKRDVWPKMKEKPGEGVGR